MVRPLQHCDLHQIAYLKNTFVYSAWLETTNKTHARRSKRITQEMSTLPCSSQIHLHAQRSETQLHVTNIIQLI